MAEVFSDDFNLKIGDLLSNLVYPATRQPCARPFMLMRPIQEPKTLPEYAHFETSDPLKPLPGKNTYFLLMHRHLEAGLFLALPRCAPPHIASSRLSHPSTCTPTLRFSHFQKHHT
jgi:hypothetical protein